MTDNTNPQDLIALLRTFIGDTQIVRAAREASDVIEQQAARIAEFERILDGLPQDAIDGGWTARGISAYAKQLESRLAAPVADSAMAKDARRKALEAAARICDSIAFHQSGSGALALDCADAIRALDDVDTVRMSGSGEPSLRALYEDACIAANKNAKDAELLNFLRDESLDLRCIDVPTGGGDADVRWIVVQHHMSEPHEREIARSFTDEPRDAITAAIAASAEKGDQT